MRLHCCYYLVVLFLSLQAVAAAEPASSRPMLYNYVTEGGPAAENMLKAKYGARYTIVPAKKTSGLIPANLPNKTYPLYGRVPGGSGKVLVAFIAAPDGHVKDPVVLYSTNPRLDRMVREMVSKWLCEPAQLNGTPVPTILSEGFSFGRLRR